MNEGLGALYADVGGFLGGVMGGLNQSWWGAPYDPITSPSLWRSSSNRHWHRSLVCGLLPIGGWQNVPKA